LRLRLEGRDAYRLRTSARDHGVPDVRRMGPVARPWPGISGRCRRRYFPRPDHGYTRRPRRGNGVSRDSRADDSCRHDGSLPVSAQGVRRPSCAVQKAKPWACACLLLIPTLAIAHTGEPLHPHDLWSAWEVDPGVIVPLALSAVLYLRGA